MGILQNLTRDARKQISLGGAGKVAAVANPAAVAGTLAAGGGQIVGQYMANEANLKMQKISHRFQRKMSNTAHRRAVRDLKKAGLNPILSAAYGGSSSPPGGTGSAQQNIMSDLASTAMQTSRLSSEIKNIEANTRKANAEAKVTEDAGSKSGVISNAWDSLGRIVGDSLGKWNSAYDAMKSPNYDWARFNVERDKQPAKKKPLRIEIKKDSSHYDKK